jgi:hypothetical protein
MGIEPTPRCQGLGKLSHVDDAETKNDLTSGKSGVCTSRRAGGNRQNDIRISGSWVDRLNITSRETTSRIVAGSGGSRGGRDSRSNVLSSSTRDTNGHRASGCDSTSGSTKGLDGSDTSEFDSPTTGDTGYNLSATASRDSSKVSDSKGDDISKRAALVICKLWHNIFFL